MPRCWTVNAVSWRPWRSNLVVHPKTFYSIFTMTGNRASFFEQSWRDASEPLVHPVPRHNGGGGSG